VYHKLTNRINDYKNLSINRQRLIYNALKKYPLHLCRFIVIESCKLEDRHDLEIFWIKEFNTHRLNNPFGLNLTHGGKGAPGALRTGNSIKRKFGINCGEKNGNYQRPYTPDEIDKMRDAKAFLILNFETGIYYSGTREAAKYNGIKRGTLTDWVRGRYPNKSNLQYV